MLIRPHDNYVKKQFLKDLGLESEYCDPRIPLPNQKPSSEGEFWAWRASQGFQIEAWIGQQRDDRGWFTLILYYLGNGGGHELLGGGFGVKIYRDYPKPTEVDYVTWTPCIHEMRSRNVGKCLNEYTCARCGRGYTVDSSD